MKVNQGYLILTVCILLILAPSQFFNFYRSMTEDKTTKLWLNLFYGLCICLFETLVIVIMWRITPPKDQMDDESDIIYDQLTEPRASSQSQRAQSL